MQWRRRKTGTPVPRDQALRQGEISSLAFDLLGREDALAFLNTDHAALGGQPLKLATASEEGRAKVQAEIAQLAERRQSDAGLSR